MESHHGTNDHEYAAFAGLHLEMRVSVNRWIVQACPANSFPAATGAPGMVLMPHRTLGVPGWYVSTMPNDASCDAIVYSRSVLHATWLDQLEQAATPHLSTTPFPTVAAAAAHFVERIVELRASTPSLAAACMLSPASFLQLEPWTGPVNGTVAPGATDAEREANRPALAHWF